MMYKKMKPRSGSGPLNVLVIGRVSTDHQPSSNIEAGYEYAERVLKDIYDGQCIVKRLGEQASGMLVGRPTIVEACELIEAEWPDVVLMEDCSKSYRNPKGIYEIVQNCHDAGIRVIAPGDSLDTFDENWELVLSGAAYRHSTHIPDTRRRVRRTSSYAFAGGGMVLRVRFGYRKVTKEESESGKCGPRGLRMARAVECTPVFDELRRLIIAEGWGGERLAGWLNEQGVPLPAGCKCLCWEGRLVLDLLRDPILYGLRQFPKVRYEPRFRDGKHNRFKNADPQKHHYPELAHMTEAEWRTMNDALDRIGGSRKSRPAGPESERYRVPRHKTIAPLQHAVCGVCGAVCYLSGNDVMKCQNGLTHKPGGCWNHVQSSCERVRVAMVDTMLARLSRHPQAHQVMLDAAWDMVEQVRSRSGIDVRDADREVADLESQTSRLADAIRDGGKLDSLLAALQAVEKELRKARSKRDEMLKRAPDDRFPTARDQLHVDPRSALLELARSSYEFADLMRTVFTRVSIQPVQALDSGLVRPRAVLTLDLSQLAKGARSEAGPQPENFTVDLFEPPVHIQHLPAILKLKRQKLGRRERASLSVLAAELKINRMTVKRALGYAKLMEKEGLAEPYRVLMASPPQASRWKPRKRAPAAAAAKAVA